jgi:hypothetical protein
MCFGDHYLCDNVTYTDPFSLYPVSIYVDREGLYVLMSHGRLVYGISC